MKEKPKERKANWLIDRKDMLKMQKEREKKIENFRKT